MFSFLTFNIKQTQLCMIFMFVITFSNCNYFDGLPLNVTYTEHIAPIFNKHCIVCHRRGGVSHFGLTNYTDVQRNAGSIVYVVKEKIMPPWPADPNYSHFIGEKILTDKEIKTIIKWVNQGAIEGPNTLTDADNTTVDVISKYPIGSVNGKPDLRIPVQPYMLQANSNDRFLLVKVPFELDNDTFVKLIEFVPGRKNVVHHVNGDLVKYKYNEKKTVYGGERIVNMEEDTIHLLKAFEKLDLPNDDGSYPILQKSVVNYLPGAYGQIYPEGIGGYLLPRKGAFLLNDLHYGFTGKDSVLDCSYIDIYFSKKPPLRPLDEFQLGTIGLSPVEPDLIIQPNTIKPVYSKFKVPFDISIVTINPHMHLLGKSFKAYALKPDGDTIHLISIPKWDFKWQYFYTFHKMVKIPKGSTIVAEGVYDNTTNNLYNPFNPPRLVKDNNGSMKATDEMFQFIVSYLRYEEGDENKSLEQ